MCNCKHCGHIKHNQMLLRKYRPEFPVDFNELDKRYKLDRVKEITSLVKEGKFNKKLAEHLLRVKL